MQRQFRYVLSRLSGPFVVITLCLAVVVWMTQSLRFIELIVNHGLSMSTFLTLTALMMPMVLAVIMPVATFIAVIHVYHRMIADSEFIALRATGSSNARLAAPALALGGLVALAVLAINLYFMPAGLRAFKDRQFVLRHSLASLLLHEGVFNTPIEGVTVFVRERTDGGDLRGILVYDSRDTVEPTIVVAERGVLLSTAEGPRFVLENGSRQQIDREAGRPSFLFFDRYAFDFAGGAEIPAGRNRESSERYLGELLHPGEAPTEHRRREFAAEAFHRLVSPFYGIVLAAIACAALLGGEFDRRGQLWRVFAAAAAGGAFLGLALGLRNAMAGAPWLALPYCLAVPAFSLAAVYLFVSDTGWRVVAGAVGNVRRARAA